MTLPASGMYTVELDPSGTSTGSAILRVYDIVDVVEPITPNGLAASAPMLTPGQRALVTFEGEAGHRMSVNVTVTSGAFGCVWYIRIRKADGTVIPNGSGSSCSSSGFLEPVTLPEAGLYTAEVDPAVSGTGNAVIHVYDVVDVTGAIAPNGASVSAPLLHPGQRALLTFEGATGDRMSVNVTVTSGAFGCVWDIRIRKTDGTVIPNGSAASCSSAGFLEPVTLPEAGLYTVEVDPTVSATGTAAIRLYNFVDVTGPIAPNGASVSAALLHPGQRALLTFGGEAGQRMSVNVTVTGGHFGCVWYIRIRKADGTVIPNGSGSSCSSSGFLEPVTLPETGLYTVEIDPAGSTTGSAVINVYDVVDVTGQIAPNGASVSAPLLHPGQRALLTFEGATGQRMSVNVTMTGGHFGCVWYIQLLKPDQSVLGSSSSCSGAGGSLGPLTLSSSGSHTVVVNPAGSSTGVANITLSLVP